MSHFKKATHFDQYNGNEARIAKDEADLEAMEAASKEQAEPVQSEEDKSEEEFKEAYSEVEIKAIDEKARRHSTAWAQKRWNEAEKAKAALAESQKRTVELERQLAESAMPRSEDQHSEWANENPESAAQVGTMIQQNSLIVNDQIQALKDELATLRNNAEVVAAESAEDKAFKELTALVPEAPTLLEDTAFNEWLASRPAMEQIINGTLDVNSAASVLNTYKFELAHKTPEAASKAQQQTEIEEVAGSIKSSSNSPEQKTAKRIWKGSDIAAMSQKEYEAREAEIDLAINEGRWLPEE